MIGASLVNTKEDTEFESLMKTHQRRVYNFAYRMAADPDDAEDLTQEAFIRAYKAFPSFEGGRPFMNWMMRIVTHLYVDMLRTRKRRVTTVSMDAQLTQSDGAQDVLFDMPDSAENPEEVLMSNTFSEQVEHALERLTAEQRTLVLLRGLQDMSCAEISEILQVPVGTVRSKIHRVRASLRHALADHFPAQPGTTPRHSVQFAIVSTYPPTECGIATFSNDLARSIGEVNGSTPEIVAVAAGEPRTRFPNEVAVAIAKESREEYIRVARRLNNSAADVVNIQHEFGIFGGPDGQHVLDLIRGLDKPVISTLHTVLPEPSTGQRKVMRELCAMSEKVVILNSLAHGILRDVYGVAPSKIVTIRHGVPDVPLTEPAVFQRKLGLRGSPVLLTLGLLGPGKGIELALAALPQVVKEFPKLKYLVVGATHPALLKSQGEKYRKELEGLVERLGLQDNVSFINRFLDKREFMDYLLACEVYLTPYRSKDQISSGPLAQAMAAGRVVVSTPYAAAVELLDGGRGILTPFADPQSLAHKLIAALSDPHAMARMRTSSYRFTRSLTWQSVAADYLALARNIESRFAALRTA